jgi:F0F1-type ATP synthase membrane subunit c/vacuolar-type H+-ATPase subunit K
MNELEKQYRIAKLIGMAMIGSLFIYVLFVEIIKATHPPFKGFSLFPEIEILRYIFFAVAIMEFFIIRFIRNLILQRKEGLELPSQQADLLLIKVRKLFTSTIITYVMCESVAIFGFVLFLIGRNSFDFYLFVVLSIIFYFVYFPRYRQWMEWVNAS